TRNIAEIANNAVPAFRQRNTIDLPLMDLSHSAIKALPDPLWHDMGLPRRERLTKSVDHLIRVRFWAEIVDHFIEIAPDRILDASERPERKGVHGSDSKITVHQVNGQGCFVQKGFELLSPPPQALLGLVAEPRHFDVRLHACQK